MRAHLREHVRAFGCGGLADLPRKRYPAVRCTCGACGVRAVCVRGACGARGAYAVHVGAAEQVDSEATGENKALMMEQGIRAFPTFHFYINSQRCPPPPPPLFPTG